MNEAERSRLISFASRLDAAKARWLQSTPPFYKGRKTTMEEHHLDGIINRDNYIKELQELRRDVATLHNHKEVVAYTALSLNIAGASWIATRATPSWILLLTILSASILLHFMMRFQLIQRWHCTQFYQVYREAIVDLSLGPANFSSKTVDKLDLVRPSLWQTIWTYITWTRSEAIYNSSFNYPTTDFLDSRIKKYNDLFSTTPVDKGGRKNSTVEKIPTYASLSCIALVVLHMVLALWSSSKISSPCIEGLINDPSSTLRSVTICTK